MFASRVFPGAALVRAIFCRTDALIRLDFPTFERPTRATSGRPSPGKSAAPAPLVMKVAVTFNEIAEFRFQTADSTRAIQSEIRNLQSV
jgi:hypothetical protein